MTKITVKHFFFKYFLNVTGQKFIRLQLISFVSQLTRVILRSKSFNFRFYLGLTFIPRNVVTCQQLELRKTLLRIVLKCH